MKKACTTKNLIRLFTEQIQYMLLYLIHAILIPRDFTNHLVHIFYRWYLRSKNIK